jgi:hypothetical protein
VDVDVNVEVSGTSSNVTTTRIGMAMAKPVSQRGCQGAATRKPARRAHFSAAPARRSRRPRCRP